MENEEKTKNAYKLVGNSLYRVEMKNVKFELNWYKDDEYQFYTSTSFEEIIGGDAEVEGYELAYEDEDFTSHEYDYKKLVQTTNKIAKRFLNLINTKKYGFEEEIYEVKIKLFNDLKKCEDEYVVKLMLT